MSCCALGQSPMERGSQQEAGGLAPRGVSKMTSDTICSSPRLPGKESGACVGLGDGETPLKLLHQSLQAVFSPGSQPGAQGSAQDAQ